MSKAGVYAYLTGTAGSGKSSMTGAFVEWCRNHSVDAVTVNLDPGAERLPYTPDVDVRDWIRLKDLMEQEGLGPNGAQIAASDLVALQLEPLREAIDSFRCEYVLLDTPGQIELFVYRESGRVLTRSLAPEQSMVLYLMDPVLAREPASFVSQVLLANSIQFRLGLPMGHVLSKSDLLDEETLERVLEWGREVDTLRDAMHQAEPDMTHQLGMDLLQSLDSLGTMPALHAVSAAQLEGLDDIYAMLQVQFSGGEDVTGDAIDPADLLDPKP